MREKGRAFISSYPLGSSLCSELGPQVPYPLFRNMNVIIFIYFFNAPAIRWSPRLSEQLRMLKRSWGLFLFPGCPMWLRIWSLKPPSCQSETKSMQTVLCTHTLRSDGKGSENQGPGTSGMYSKLSHQTLSRAPVLSLPSWEMGLSPSRRSFLSTQIKTSCTYIWFAFK